MNTPDNVPITKTQRWLDLIAFLVRRRFPVTVDEIMEAVPAYRRKLESGEVDAESVRRTFERDKDELRELGIPLETKEYRINYGAEEAIGYRLAAKDFYLPYLRIIGRQGATGTEQTPGRPGVEITEKQARTAIEALQRVARLESSPFAREAQSALRKLAFDLDVDLAAESPVEYVEADAMRLSLDAEPLEAGPPTTSERALADREVYYHEIGTGGVREYLHRLTDALRRRKRVRFRYQGIYRGQITDRDVAPYGLLYQHSHWYMIGHDAKRDAMRVFRIGRMGEPDVAGGKRPDYEIPDDFDLTDYTRRQAWELGDDEPVHAEVRFAFPLALWADRNGHGELVEQRPGGAAVRRFEVRQVDPFLRWLQQFGGDAVIESPPELRASQAEMARQTLALYGGRGEESDDGA